MSSDVAIRIEGLGKSYRIKHQEQHITLAEQTLHRLRHPFRRTEAETFWALKDIDLEIKRGEVLGLIGRNGAGKSTLLKVLSRITPPTTGRVDVFGRIGSLLEVGTGFHPELTGRENIFLNGSILGMRKPEIQRQFDAIVDFAGVDRFLDTPVKRYSSGMYVRLAFAVAAHLETEILLVDEVLAVGDQGFQDKCLGKMGDVASEGRTVVLVTHNMDSIHRLAHRAVVLLDGSLHADGTPDAAIAAYRADFANERNVAPIQQRRQGSGEARISAATALKAPYTCADPKVIGFSVELGQGDGQPYYLAALVHDDRGRVVAHCDSRLNGRWFERDDSDVHDYRLTIDTPWLKPGRYSVDLFICNQGVIDVLHDACGFDVLDQLPYVGTASDDSVSHNIVLPDFVFEAEPTVDALTITDTATGQGGMT